MIKYLGSKRLLLGSLVEVLRSVPELTTIVDPFSGTARCGHAFKGAGYQVTSNDHNAYGELLARCYVEADREVVVERASRILQELARLPGKAGYFTETYCVRSRFFQPHNGERVDAIREEIARLSLDPVLEAVALVSLMEAADRVDSTCGLQMAYVKDWAPRSYNRLELRMPEVLPANPGRPCRAMRADANEVAASWIGDVAYLDPPYNQHSYLSNYHIWESLALWDKPEVYGVACKRVDCRTRKSDYNSKRRHAGAFRELVTSLQAQLIVVSFSDEGFQSRRELESLLAERGTVYVIAKDFKRYVGAQIGIHSPAGELVGNVSHLRNQEYIYLVATPELERRVPGVRGRLERVARAVADASSGESTALGPTATAAKREIMPRAEIVRQALAGGDASLDELQTRTRLSDYHLRTALALMASSGEVSVAGGGRRRRYSLFLAAAGSPARRGVGYGVDASAATAFAGERHPPELEGTLRDRVLAILREDGPLRLDQLRTRIGLAGDDLGAVVGGLVAAGKVEKLGRARGTTYSAIAVPLQSDNASEPSPGRAREARARLSSRQLAFRL